ncbi:hypothetical protein MUK42_26474 [Musa troglodytarum]|uniref:BHLH domain-containing protein n=2 Tax=Musa troglodytarum TaxID=320322 RepID=A0A9E7JL79_9LILI|nr:hypothetical protein MUK42_26474 [Musa troglodytarum]
MLPTMDRRRLPVARRQREVSAGRNGAMRNAGCRLIRGGRERHAVGVSVRRKVRELQRLVPGGRQLPAAQLFLHTADYIFHLSLKVQVLRALSKFYMP